MKKIVLLIAILFGIGSNFSQTFTGDFESWDSDYQPTGWLGNNAAPYWITITKSTDAHSGSYAVKGEVASYTGLPLAPALYCGISGTGAQVNDYVQSVSGYYKFLPQGGDIMEIAAYIYASDNSLVGAGLVEIGAQADSYQRFTLQMNIGSNKMPSNIMMTIVAADTSEGGDAHAGTYFLLDDITLSNTTDVKENSKESLPDGFALSQNYPNPFNPSTTIEYSLKKESNISLLIYNSLGKKVQTLVSNELKNAGNHKISWNPENLASGIYLCRLETEAGFQTIKLSYLK